MKKSNKAIILEIQKMFLGYNPTISDLDEQFRIGSKTRKVLEEKGLLFPYQYKKDIESKGGDIMEGNSKESKKITRPRCTSKAGTCVCGERYEVYFEDDQLKGIELINAEPIKKWIFFTGRSTLTFKCHTCGYTLKRIY